MAKHADVTYGDDVPSDIVDQLREICAPLPDAFEESAWKGVRWRVRSKTFAHVLTVTEGDGETCVVLTFRASDDELEALRATGPPFSVLGWGRNAMGLDLDDRTDWDEVRELLIESYCVMAPRKLAALAPRPTADPDA